LALLLLVFVLSCGINTKNSKNTEQTVAYSNIKIQSARLKSEAYQILIKNDSSIDSIIERRISSAGIVGMGAAIINKGCLGKKLWLTILFSFVPHYHALYWICYILSQKITKNQKKRH